MSTFLEYLSSAIKNIRSNRLRTGLTMLGIIIGIASVIAVLTIGNGLTAYVQNEMGGFAGNMSAIMVNSSVTSELITPEDIEAIEEAIPDLKGAGYDLSGQGVLTGPRAVVDCVIDGCSAVIENQYANKVMDGRYFTDDEVEARATVCVITARDAKKLFGTEKAVGMTLEFTIAGISKPLTVIGIRENYSQAILTIMDEMMEDYTAFLELPYTTYADIARVDVSKGQNQVSLFGKTGSDMTRINKTASRIIRTRHGIRDEKALVYESMSDITEEVDSIFGAITAFMSFVAAISLLVGGIGVMNIMLVSVTERTKEIGIRKSIGARTGAIMFQFLAESAIISLLGGIVGVILGIGIALIVCHFLDFTVTVDPKVVILASFFSMGVGIFFGLHPARKAAKMRPIDALRA